MVAAEIAAEIARYLEETFPNQGVDLDLETDLLHDYFIDSIAVLEMVFFIESRFAISVERADINGEVFKNLASIAQFVVQKR